MEMTIDEARTELISGNPFTNKFAMALVVAIDTMRKYKKIEQILQKQYDNGVCEEGVNDWYGMVKSVREVLEDGKA